MIIKLNKKTIQTTLKIINKIKLYIKHKFKNIINKILLITNYIKKYYLNFNNINNNIYLKTTTNYKKQHQKLTNTIQINLNNIPIIINKFKNNNIQLTKLKSIPKKITKHIKYNHIPFLIIFTKTYKNIKNTYINIKK